MMNTISTSEIKRRGISAVDELLDKGPVHVIKNNRQWYVVLTEEAYQRANSSQSRDTVDTDSAGNDAG